MQDLKVLEDDVGTRAVLSLQGATNYKIFSLQNPDRLVLDLSQARLAPGFRMPAPNGAVAGVRAGKPVSGTLRIVFDLGTAMATQSRVEHDGGVTRLIVQLSPLGRTAARLPGEAGKHRRAGAGHRARPRDRAAGSEPGDRPGSRAPDGRASNCSCHRCPSDRTHPGA